MIQKVALSAKKALSLKKDVVFRLMVVMMMLLGWLIGVGAGGLLGLEKLYSNWQLEQRSKVNVYLMAESPETEIKMMMDDLTRISGVDKVERLSREDTLALLEPYFDGQSNFPLPVVVDVVVKDEFKRAQLDSKVLQYFPTAEVDDARYLLESVGRGVRLAQTITLIIAGVLVVVMALLVTLTVRAGLRGQEQSLAVLQYVGATDGFITTLVTRQVLKQSVIGWILAIILTGLSILLAVRWQEGLAQYIDTPVLIGAFAAPLLLVILTVFFAWWTTRYVLQKV